MPDDLLHDRSSYAAFAERPDALAEAAHIMIDRVNTLVPAARAPHVRAGVIGSRRSSSYYRGAESTGARVRRRQVREEVTCVSSPPRPIRRGVVLLSASLGRGTPRRLPSREHARPHQTRMRPP